MSKIEPNPGPCHGYVTTLQKTSKLRWCSSKQKFSTAYNIYAAYIQLQNLYHNPTKSQPFFHQWSFLFAHMLSCIFIYNTYVYIYMELGGKTNTKILRFTSSLLLYPTVMYLHDLQLLLFHLLVCAIRDWINLDYSGVVWSTRSTLVIKPVKRSTSFFITIIT